MNSSNQSISITLKKKTILIVAAVALLGVGLTATLRSRFPGAKPAAGIANRTADDALPPPGGPPNHPDNPVSPAHRKFLDKAETVFKQYSMQYTRNPDNIVHTDDKEQDTLYCNAVIAVTPVTPNGKYGLGIPELTGKGWQYRATTPPRAVFREAVTRSQQCQPMNGTVISNNNTKGYLIRYYVTEEGRPTLDSGVLYTDAEAKALTKAEVEALEKRYRTNGSASPTVIAQEMLLLQEGAMVNSMALNNFANAAGWGCRGWGCGH